MENNLIDNGYIPSFDPNHDYEKDIELIKKYTKQLGFIMPVEEPKVEEIKYIPVEISKLDIHDGDTILLTFNLDECDMNTIQNIHKMWQEVLPKTVSVISTVKPIVESIQIIRDKEDKPF